MAISQQVPARLRSSRLGPWILGIDEKTESYALAADKIRDGQNLQLDEKPGSAIKRFGSRVISNFPTGKPVRDVGVFTKTDGSTFLLASDGTDLYFTTDPTLTSGWTVLKTGLTFDGFLEFETAENKVWITNGVDSVMSFDGSVLRVYDREFQSVTDATAITATTVAHTGLTEADDFWNGQIIVFTEGTNAGTRATVTDFDDATNTLTFTPALPNAPAVSDRFKVGIIIPKGRVVRFWDAHLWMGSTDTNTSELRFHRLTDPVTGADIDIDDPLAWPSTFQLDINSADGDRVWAISPILRDRILVTKSTGVFRIERDPLTIYTFEVVARAIGSRFQRSFAEKKTLLYFVGQDKDGLPDVYKTDMVTVVPVDPLGGFDPTLNNLRQPNSVQRLAVFGSKQDFDTGTKSTLVKTLNSLLEIGKFGPDVPLTGTQLVAASNIDLESNPGSAVLLGNPKWTERYEADDLPEAATPDWNTFRGAGIIGSIVSGVYNISGSGLPANTTSFMRRSELFSSSSELFGVIRFKLTPTAGKLPDLEFQISNGVKKATFIARTASGWLLNGVLIPGFSSPTTGIFFNVNLLLKTDGTSKVWIDGVLAATVAGTDSTDNKIEVSTNDFVVDIDYVYHHASFKGDSLNDQNGKVTVTTLPNTLPTSGTYRVQNNLTRVPDALRRLFHDSVLNGGTVGLESRTSDTTDFSTGNDPAGFVVVANGAVPTSLLKEFQRVRTTITRSDFVNSPEVKSHVGGFLWLSPPIFIGSNIVAWRTFQATLTTPSGAFAEIKIRGTAVAASPVEGDFGAFATIVDGDNIGTILSDGSPPTTRNVQIKIELGPSSAGLLPTLQNFVLQWNEGSEDILPLHAVVHKKRYLFAAARLTSAANDVVIVNDRNEGWMRYIGWPVNAMIHFRGVLVGFKSTEDKVLELDCPVFSDEGVAIDAFLDTREEVLAKEDLRKDFRYGVIHLGPVVGTLDVSLKRVSDSDFTSTKTLVLTGKSLDRRINFPSATLTKRIQRRYRNNNIEPMEVRGETLYYALRSQLPNGG